MANVPMTMGLVSTPKKKKPMLTYKVFPVGSNGGMAVKATSLPSLRKKLIKEYPKGMYDIYRLYEPIGGYRCDNNVPEWWIRGGAKSRWWEIDPKTGKIGVSDGTGRHWYYVNEKGEPEDNGRSL